MSFTIKLQTNTSEKNKLDKTVTTLAELNGTLKDKTSITDPVILVEIENPASTLNYITIPVFGRSYFVTDIVNVNNKLFEIHAHVDVLSSFKTQIRTNRAIIERQEFKHNAFLSDAGYHVYQNPNVTTESFPQGFDTTNSTFVLAMAGGTL